MRVLVVAQNYPRAGHSGDGVFVHRLNCGLRSLGADVHVLQLAEWSPPWPLSNLLSTWREDRARRNTLLRELDAIPLHHPVTVTPRPSRFFPGDHWERQAETLARYVRRRSKLARADVVLSHFLVPDGYHGLRLAETLGVPSVAMAWGDDVHAWPAKWPYWRGRLIETISGTSSLVACSHRLAMDGNSWISTPREWQVVYGGVDLTRFFPADESWPNRRRALGTLEPVIGAKGRVLTMLAQPVRAKGYIEMLDAWRVVSAEAPEWHLVMAGGNWAELDIPGEIAARQLGGRAHWIGARPAEDIPDLLRASDAFALPSHNEGLSLSVLEALATGLATIATDVGGHAEIMKDGVNGWLIPPKDVEALVRALRQLTSSQTERSRRGAAARMAATRVGSPAENASRLLLVLQDAITRKKAPAACQVSFAG